MCIRDSCTTCVCLFCKSTVALLLRSVDVIQILIGVDRSFTPIRTRKYPTSTVRACPSPSYSPPMTSGQEAWLLTSSGGWWVQTNYNWCSTPEHHTSETVNFSTVVSSCCRVFLIFFFFDVLQNSPGSWVLVYGQPHHRANFKWLFFTQLQGVFFFSLFTKY